MLFQVHYLFLGERDKVQTWCKLLRLNGFSTGLLPRSVEVTSIWNTFFFFFHCSLIIHLLFPFFPLFCHWTVRCRELEYLARLRGNFLVLERITSAICVFLRSISPELPNDMIGQLHRWSWGSVLCDAPGTTPTLQYQPVWEIHGLCSHNYFVKVTVAMVTIITTWIWSWREQSVVKLTEQQQRVPVTGKEQQCPMFKSSVWLLYKDVVVLVHFWDSCCFLSWQHNLV